MTPVDEALTQKKKIKHKHEPMGIQGMSRNMKLH